MFLNFSWFPQPSLSFVVTLHNNPTQRMQHGPANSTYIGGWTKLPLFDSYNQLLSGRLVIFDNWIRYNLIYSGYYHGLILLYLIDIKLTNIKCAQFCTATQMTGFYMKCSTGSKTLEIAALTFMADVPII